MELMSVHLVKPPLDSFAESPNWFADDYAAKIKATPNSPLITQIITSDIPATCFALSLSRVCVVEAQFSPDHCLSLSFPLCCYQTKQKHNSSYFVSRWSVCGASHTRTVRTPLAVVKIENLIATNIICAELVVKVHFRSWIQFSSTWIAKEIDFPVEQFRLSCHRRKSITNPFLIQMTHVI